MLLCRSAAATGVPLPCVVAGTTVDRLHVVVVLPPQSADATVTQPAR